LGDHRCANPAVHHLPETIAWTGALRQATQDALPHGMPIIMGGDHSLALGTVAGVAAHAAAQGRAQFVIWLDAHSDFHTVATTTSGNLHGTPMAYANGLDGFDPFPPFPALPTLLRPSPPFPPFTPFTLFTPSLRILRSSPGIPGSVPR
ncbi:MAG: arginase family protein, partial [Acidobacteria bacterium]|nr:arginase family protein [Acidobacteriota bacterium]